MGDNLSPADISAVVGNTDRNNFAYPVYGGNFGGNGGFGSDGGWFWLFLILAMMNGGWGNGFGGGFGGDNMYPWLSNGQKEIMQNTNQGFDTLQLANQLTGISSGVQNLSTQLCNCCADMNQTVNAGFANAETAANSRQMANMQQAYSNQLSTLQGFNGVTAGIADASAENRLGIANLNSTILAENCADRAALSEGLREVVINQTANTQKILDTLCQDKIDAKNEKIADLQRELQMADLKASQIEQNAFISRGFADEVDALYNRLSNCPVPSTPVYGRTPIFTCNSGCGCGNAYGNTIV
jgi:hypothetical protein